MNAVTKVSEAGTQVVGATSLLAVIANAATNPAVDVVKMTALLDMQERLERRQAEADFNAALVRVTTGMPRVKKNGTIDLKDKGSIPFAKWEDVDAVIRPRLEQEGFVLSFDSVPKEGGGLIVTGRLLHSAGHSLTASIPLALDTGPGRNNLQSMGSSLSYGKRYVAEMLLNIVREGTDDDGKRGGTVYITEAQVNELEALIKETKTNEGRFLQIMSGDGVRSLEEVETKDFGRLKNALLTKKTKNERAQ